MSKGNWSIRIAVIGAIAALTAVALGTGAFLGASHTPNFGYQSTVSSDRRAQSKNEYPSQIDRDRAGLPGLAERIASGPDPKDNSEREKRDLAAQESMSVWAFWMLAVSAVGVTTTMIGTFLLVWQIILTRRAVEETSEATDAMRVANSIAEDAQRPWVKLSLLSVEFHQPPEPGYAPGFYIKIGAENFGSSPALTGHAAVQIVTDVAIRETPEADLQALSAKVGNSSTPHRTIYPSESQVVLDQHLSFWGEQAELIRDRVEGKERGVTWIVVILTYCGVSKFREFYVCRRFVLVKPWSERTLRVGRELGDQHGHVTEQNQ